MADAKPKLKRHPAGTVLAVKVVPNASRDRIVGLLGEAVKVATSAAPEKGKANKAVAAILAGAMGIAERDVELISAPSRPRKEFLIRNTSPNAVTKALGPLL